MVSPRKRILQASTTVRPSAGGTPPVNGKLKTKVKIPLAFKDFKFYLDIRGKAKASLIEDLKNLGGVSKPAFLFIISVDQVKFIEWGSLYSIYSMQVIMGKWG